MAKVFNGKEFLKGHAVELQLSNGKTYQVTEVMPETMAEIQKLEETDADDAKSARKILSKLCDAPLEDFSKIGIVEGKGALDFLLENLFNVDSQT